MLADLSPYNQKLAAQIAAVPLTIRGYGHVKLANLSLAHAREAELMHRFAPDRYPKPAAAAQAGQFPEIAVVASGELAAGARRLSPYDSSEHRVRITARAPRTHYSGIRIDSPV